MMRNLLLSKKTGILLIVLAGLLVGESNLFGATYYSISSSNWTDRNTWSTTSNGTRVGKGIYPGAGDDVVIERGFTVTQNIVSANCRNFTITSGVFILGTSLTTSNVLTISGNYTQSGGVFDFNNVSNGTMSIVYLAGNLSSTAGIGSITTQGSGAENGQICFNGSSYQTLNFSNSNAATWTTFLVNSGSSVRLSSNITLTGSNSSAKYYADLVVNGTVDFGTYVINDAPYASGTAASHFELNNGASLVTANPNGISTSGAAGSVQFLGSRTYGSGANYTYNGTSAQVAGNGLTAANNLTINNAAGVTLSTPTSVSGTLTLTSGTLTTTINLLSVTNTATSAISGGSSSFINGPVKWSIGTGIYLFPVGKSIGNYLPFTLTTTASSSPVITVEAFKADLGASATFDETLASISHTEYWKTILNSGTFTGSVSIDRGSSISPLNVIAGSASQTGSFTSLDGSPSSTGVSNSTAVGTNRYFVLAEKKKPTVSFTTASQSSASENGTMTVTVQLSAASTQTVTIPFTLSGTATGGGTDYSIIASPITINAGSTTGSTTITIVDDALVEGNETVILTLGAPTNATLGATTVHTATITDNDVAIPTVSFTTASQSSASENGTMTVTVQLSAASAQTVTIPFSLSGTATGGGTDYTIIASPITINAGSTAGSTTITIVDDGLVEGNETVILTLGTPTNATLGATTVHTATITDNDVTIPTVSFTTASQSSASENGTMTVTVQLSAASAQTVTIPFSLSGTATGGGTDYTIIASPITINAGSTAGSTTITIVDDALVEGNETVILTLGTPTNATLGATTVHTATITDTDVALTPSVSLTLDKTTIAENGGVATVTATLSNTGTQPVTIWLNYSGTAGNGSDYTYSSNSITIAAGSLSGTVTLTSVNDCIVEGNETLIVDVSSVTNGTENGIQQVTTNIIDDDLYPTITLSSNNLSIPENGGAVIVTATLSNTFCQSIDIYVNFTGSTATNTTDYNYSSNKITIPSGSISGTITISSINDYLVEGIETVVLGVESTNVAGISTSVSPVSVTIVDDDSYSITVTPTSGLVTTETGLSATFTVVLNAITYNDVTIQLTSNDLTEGTVSPASLTFTSGNFFTPQTVTVTGVDDALADGNISYTVITSAAVSFDANYNGINPLDISVINTDNEVTSNNIWYRADAGITGDVTSWTDQSGNNINATNSGSVSKVDNSINFNPSLSLTSVNRQFVISGTKNIQSIIVVNKTPETNSDLAGLIGADGDKGIRLSNNVNELTPVVTPYLSWRGNNNTDDWVNTTNNGTGRINGINDASMLHSSKWHIANITRYQALSGTYYIGGYYSGRPYTGNIAEVMAFDNDPSDGAIESYLAIKYGITLGSTSSVVNYVSPSGTVIWTGSSTYQNDIAGLGKESSYMLDQKVSSSINTPSGTSARIVMATDNDFTSSNQSARTSLSNGQYLIWGHNNLGVGSLIIDGDFDRVARIWKVQNTGVSSSVNFQTDLTGFPNPSELSLILDDDANLSNGGATVVSLSNTTGSLYSASINFPTGTSYFTIGKCKPLTVTLTSSDSDNTFCVGTSLTFTASGGINYNFRVGGTSVQNSTTSTYTTTTLTNGQIVDVIVTNGGGCTATSIGIPNIVLDLPTVSTASVSPTSVCGSGQVAFSATASSGTIKWYDALTGGNEISVLNPTISSTTTYYAEATSPQGCISTSRTAVTAIVNTLPTVSSASVSPTSVCGAGQVTFSAMASSGIIKWYDALTGGNEISVLNPTISSTTTYYAEATSPQGCKSTVRIGVTALVNPLPTAYDVTGGGLYCSGGSGLPVGLDNSQAGVNYQLYKDASSVGSPIPGTGSAISFGSQTSEGTYTVKATNATTFCVQDMTKSTSITIGDTTPPLITKCLIGGTYGCVASVPAAITTIQGFRDAGGDVTDNCTAPMTVTHNDVITPGSACKVSRVYTITDALGNKATCTQEFTITDTQAPVINSVENLLKSPNDNSCGASLTIAAPVDAVITEYCSLVAQGAYYKYTIAGTEKTGYGAISDIFPEGTTVITWTIADVCGNVSLPKTQTVEVAFGLTPVSYDNGSTATSVGSGVQPMQTSTHEYYVDDKIAEIGYTYSWGLFVDNGGVPGAAVDPSFYSITSLNPADVQITFKNANSIPIGNYIISVIKTKNETICKKQQTIQIAVQSNSSFDVSIGSPGDQCQAPGLNATTTIRWNVIFPAVSTEPFMFNYEIKKDGTAISSGAVSNISYSTAIPLTPTSSGTLPYSQYSKNANSLTVVVQYTFYSETGLAGNHALVLSITGVTDAYQVSEPNIINNTDELQTYGVINTSAITTD